MSREAVIIGYSGHAYVIIDILLNRNFKIKGYLDVREAIKNPYRLAYLGVENDPRNFDVLRDNDIFIGVGANEIREKIFKSISLHHVLCPPVVHPSAVVSASAEIMQGTVVMPGAIINAYAKVGIAVICNSASVIEHECVIGNYVHIAPGTILAGNVTVGDNSFVGANSVIKQGTKVGKNVTIGAGSVILNDIPDGALVYGNPGKIR